MKVEELERLVALINQFMRGMDNDDPMMPLFYEVLEEVREERDLAEEMERANHVHRT